MYEFANEQVLDTIVGTDVLAGTIMEMAREDPRVVAMDADLCFSSNFKLIRDEAPEHFIQCGVMEAHMISAAAGMSEAGMIPFTHTFAAFATRRCLDQIFLSACFNRLNVKIIGTDPGVDSAHNGATHQGLDDMSQLMGLPNITLLEPSDCVMMEDLLRQMKATWGTYYMRTFRKGSFTIYKPGSTFEIGKGNLLKDGTDISLIASGNMVAEALEASTVLAGKGISARVVDMFTWKPLDRELVVQCAAETGAIVTAENHQATCGLGSAVAAVTAEECPVPMDLVGIQDRFSETGTLGFLREKFGLQASNIVEAATRVVARKKSA